MSPWPGGHLQRSTRRPPLSDASIDGGAKRQAHLAWHERPAAVAGIVPLARARLTPAPRAGVSQVRRGSAQHMPWHAAKGGPGSQEALQGQPSCPHGWMHWCKPSSDPSRPSPLEVGLLRKRGGLERGGVHLAAHVLHQLHVLLRHQVCGPTHAQRGMSKWQERRDCVR